MADLTVKENTTIIIKKNKGITHALRDLVKKNPNSILSDGKITAKEWNAVLDTLIDINNSRKVNNQKPIFTGGTDKSRSGWHSSFVVHPNQKIEFTAEEMSALYSAMGVTLKSSENSENAAEQKVESNPDTTVVTQPDKQDTIPALKADTVLEKTELDTSKVVPGEKQDTVSVKSENPDTAEIVPFAQKDSVALPPAEHEKTVISTDDSTAVQESAAEDSSTKSRYELSWGEIGKISLKSAKNFVKGMFCDENGFSLKRTAATVGVVAGLALAAPVAAAAGASAAVVGGIALGAKAVGLGLAGVMAYNGGKNAIEGGIKYYNSTTEEEAKANMEQAMDGAVEAAAAFPAFFAIKGGANKGNKIAQNKASQKPLVEEAPKTEAKPAEVKPQEAPKTEVKPAESNSAPEVKPLEESIQLTDEPAPKAEPKPAEEVKLTEVPKSEAKPTEAKAVDELKPQDTPKTEVKPAEIKPEQPKQETKSVEPVDYSTRLEIVRTNNGFKIERHRNADGTISRDVVFDKNEKYSYTKQYQYTSDGAEAGYTFDWASGSKDVFKAGSNQGVRTKADGTQWIIKKEGSKILEVEQIKPNAETQAAEAKPAPEAAPKAEAKNVETSNAPEQAAETSKPVEALKVQEPAFNQNVQGMMPGADGNIVPTPQGQYPFYNMKQVSPNEALFELNLSGGKAVMGEFMGAGLKESCNVQIVSARPDAIRILKPGKVELKNGKWVIKEKMEIEFYDSTKPSAQVKPVEDVAPKAETKPAEVKVEETKVETKTEDVKPAENTVNDYNKAVRSEIDKLSDGRTWEYFYNKDGTTIKDICRDQNGNIDCENVYHCNSKGQQIKHIYKSENDICETLYENGLETKKSWKWADGKVDELKPVGENVYDGVRTYPDGRKVKIKQKDWVTIELGPVE